MHANRIVARVLVAVQGLMHAARYRALSDVTHAAVIEGMLSLTGLALRTTIHPRDASAAIRAARSDATPRCTRLP